MTKYGLKKLHCYLIIAHYMVYLLYLLLEYLVFLRGESILEKKTQKKFIRLLIIFLSALKMGAVTFGGGLAMIPVIEHEYCEKRGWVAKDEIGDITAVAQTLPGMIAVNASMLAAYRADGAAAAIVAGIGCVLPSLVILCAVAVFYNAFVTNPYVRGALRGVSGAVIALFIKSLIKMIKSGLVDIYTVVIFVAAAVLIFVFPSLNVIFIILGGGVIGLVLYYFILRRGRGPKIDG